MSRVRLSDYPGSMGNGGGTRTMHARSVTIREDDEIEMVPNYPYITAVAHNRADSEERKDSSDLETGVIRVQKDWYVTEEKVENSGV